MNAYEKFLTIPQYHFVNLVRAVIGAQQEHYCVHV